ncbi:Fic family protein [Xylocopilactobacillus apicola]|uniref:Cell division protein Fic n=1 Tax=Xylocopilactobacillus apicola TaxID=2932184 RepID=A0AAU9DRL5_9LACO|nr:Fic family protein [Xylocopilactobacillus apicola]BDR57818.1 cell division protein Fic [Xylocopilactobacillus apicola]
MAVKKFNYQNLNKLDLDYDLLNSLTKIHEFKGKEELYLADKSYEFDRLKNLAMIQSTEASNRIEGISTTDARLKQLIADKTTPINRDEEEIAGYRDVLKLIHEDYQYLELNRNNILALHKKLYEYSPQNFRGKFKANDNVITENEKIRFRPAPAYLTPMLIDDLCNEYKQAIQQEKVDPLILIPCFILDFLSIHPFTDGNGRMSRLLTMLLMYQSGYVIGKYISIEHLIEKTKSTYYESLDASSVGWFDNVQDYTPFVRYFLGVILRANEELIERFELMRHSISSADRVISELHKALQPLSRAELEMSLPAISQRTIERALAKLQKENKIEKVGQGRSTRYRGK